MDTAHTWPAPHTNQPTTATVRLSGSKSMTNRALAIAALADGTSTVRNPLHSRDSALMVAALRCMGTTVKESADGAWQITPGRRSGSIDIDCGLAGTVMRFLPPLATLVEGSVRFDGDRQARERPMHTVLNALRLLGADITEDRLPFEIRGRGRLPGGQVKMDASPSSQFVSGLLLAGARFEQGVTVVHCGNPVPSLPHIAMTVEMLRQAGVEIDDSEPDTWRVSPGPIRAMDTSIEPDLSNAAPFVAAAAVTGGTITIPCWPECSMQPGDAIRYILAKMGASWIRTEHGTVVTGPDRLRGINADLHEIGELTPTIAALAALSDGPSHLHGIAHLRGHETDRLTALQSEINGLGGDVEQTHDGLIITPRVLHAGKWRSYADHRMATAGAILGLRVPGIEVDDIATTAKTSPDFPILWKEMLNES